MHSYLVDRATIKHIEEGCTVGFMDGLLGKKETYPALDPSGDAAARLVDYKGSLESLAKRAKARLEVVPTADGLYVYIGKPPKEFGIVWFTGKEEHTFMAAMTAKGLSKAQVQKVSDDLRTVYIANEGQPRYSFSIDGTSVVVTPAQSFAADIERVLSQAGG